jgi:hexosaminidase
MDPTRDRVYDFLDEFIKEMAALFPDSYFHIGGDEVNGKQWDANPQIQDFKRSHGFKSNNELQATSLSGLKKSSANSTKTWWAGMKSSRPACPTIS